MRLVLGTLLLGALAFPMQAQALPIDSDVTVKVELLQGSGGVYAVTTVTSQYHLATWGDLYLNINGRLVKVEPVATSDRQVIAALVGQASQPLNACATFSGRFSVGGDNTRNVQVLDCDYRPANPGLASPVMGRDRASAGRLPSMGLLSPR